MTPVTKPTESSKTNENSNDENKSTSNEQPQASHEQPPADKNASQNKKPNRRQERGIADLDESEQHLDWAESTAADEAAAAKTGASAPAGPTEAKKARQKAKQKKKAARKAAPTSGGGSPQVNSTSPATATTTKPTSLATPAPPVSQGKQADEAPSAPPQKTSESSDDTLSTAGNKVPVLNHFRGRGRGGGFARGYAPAHSYARGRGAFAGRGGFARGVASGGFGPRNVPVQSPSATVEWPNGVAPPTMPRAQREELERKRQASAVAVPEGAQVAPSVGSESVPSRSGTATPATTAASSSPAGPGNSEETSEQAISEKLNAEKTPVAARHAGVTFPPAGGFFRGSPFRRGRGSSFAAFRGRGGAFAGPPRRGFYADATTIQPKSHLQFGSLAGSADEDRSDASDRRQEAAALAAESARDDGSVVVRLPGTRKPAGRPGPSAVVPSTPVTSSSVSGLVNLPPGFAMDAEMNVWDLRRVERKLLGPQSHPGVQAQLQAAANAEVSKEPLPPHMRALFGQPPAISNKGSSHIPKSAARAAAFKPSSASRSASSEAGSSTDSHDPTAHQPYDSPMPYSGIQHMYPHGHTPPPPSEAYDYAYGEVVGPLGPMYYHPQNPYYETHHDQHPMQYSHEHHQQQHQPYPSTAHHRLSHSYSYGHHPSEFQFPAGAYDGVPVMEYFDPQMGAPLNDFDPSIGHQHPGEIFYMPPAHAVSHQHLPRYVPQQYYYGHQSEHSVAGSGQSPLPQEAVPQTAEAA